MVTVKKCFANSLQTSVISLGMSLLTTLSQSCIPVTAQTENGQISFTNQASYSYTDATTKDKYQGFSSQLVVITQPLNDPLGRILGCNGQVLPDYTGFSVGIYNPLPGDSTQSELGNLVSLTPTQSSNGLKPNVNNSNPYNLSNQDPRGSYNFLLDQGKGQIDAGKTYILVINPPQNSIYSQRRIKIKILGENQNVVSYTATSLDGQPITTTGNTTVTNTITVVPNSQTVGLELFVLNFSTGMCQANQLQITKSGDRATAQPGDTAIYRISIKDVAEVGMKDVVVTDSLPLGFSFLSKSVKAEINGSPVTVTSISSGSTVTFQTDATIPNGEVLNIAYAAQLNGDAVRGTGINSAVVNAQRVDNSFPIKDGPVNYQIQVQPGILSDCGTIIGRVFIDRNFDGEQQAGEPGLADAVIYLENGNRITTDKRGLFSVANVYPGVHTGVLDLSSIPGYTLAPNHKFREGNSQSRLVRLEPGGLVRMNFAVMPISGKEVKK